MGNRLDPLRGHRFEHAALAHLRLFTPSGLTAALEHHGFARVTVWTAGYYPLPPPLARIATAIDRRHGAFLVATAEVAP